MVLVKGYLRNHPTLSQEEHQEEHVEDKKR